MFVVPLLAWALTFYLQQKCNILFHREMLFSFTLTSAIFLLISFSMSNWVCLSVRHAHNLHPLKCSSMNDEVCASDLPRPIFLQFCLGVDLNLLMPAGLYQIFENHAYSLRTTDGTCSLFQLYLGRNYVIVTWVYSNTF